MAIESPETPKANGLKTAIDIVIAPKEAFESLRVSPTWGWAFLITLVLALVAYFVMMPASLHGIAGDFAKNPQVQQMTADQQQKMMDITKVWYPIGAAFFPLILLFFSLIEALIMLVFNALGRGSGTFKTLWASSVNIGVIYGISQLVGMAVVLLRGADSFATAGEVQRAVPSLALLAPAGTGIKLVAFLATITPFSIWSIVLVVMTMTIVARVPKLQAWLAGILCWVFPALLAVVFAK
jgi:Yip1 domain